VLWPAPLLFKNFLSSSAAPIIIRPEELAVNLLRPYQLFQLFEARKRPVFKDIFRHVDPLEKIVKLLRPLSHVPATSEPGANVCESSQRTRGSSDYPGRELQNLHHSQERPRLLRLQSRAHDSYEKYRQH
jgi:hypothetical protein